MGKKEKEPKYLRIDSDTIEEEYKNNENRFRFSFVSKSILVISESGMKSVSRFSSKRSPVLLHGII